MHNSCRVIGGLMKNDCNITKMQSLPNEQRECISLSSHESSLLDEEPEMTCEWKDNSVVI